MVKKSSINNTGKKTEGFLTLKKKLKVFSYMYMKIFSEIFIYCKKQRLLRYINKDTLIFRH